MVYLFLLGSLLLLVRASFKLFEQEEEAKDIDEVKDNDAARVLAAHHKDVHCLCHHSHKLNELRLGNKVLDENWDGNVEGPIARGEFGGLMLASTYMRK